MFIFLTALIVPFQSSTIENPKFNENDDEMMIETLTKEQIEEKLETTRLKSELLRQNYLLAIENREKKTKDYLNFDFTHELELRVGKNFDLSKATNEEISRYFDLTDEIINQKEELSKNCEVENEKVKEAMFLWCKTRARNNILKSEYEKRIKDL